MAELGEMRGDMWGLTVRNVLQEITGWGKSKMAQDGRAIIGLEREN